jgi:DNA (cytosine-5)-methyltransferase 1
MARVVSEVRPQYVFVENSPMLTTRGGTRVVGDLAEMGYDCKWTVMGAADVGANHKRDRMWIVGKSKRKGLEGQRSQPRKQEVSQSRDTSALANTNDARLEWWKQQQVGSREQGSRFGDTEWWEAEPNVGRVANGVAARVDRLKAIGNGQVPLCAATAWKLLTA